MKASVTLALSGVWVWVHGLELNHGAHINNPKTNKAQGGPSSLYMPERPPIILDEALIFVGAHVLGPGLAHVPRPIIGCLGFWLLALFRSV